MTPVSKLVEPPVRMIGDLAALSDAEFAAAIERGERAQQRAEHILKRLLLKNVHYGNPIDAETNEPRYPHDILFLGGAEYLTKAFRLSYHTIAPDQITEVITPTEDFTGKIIDPGFVGVTVYRGMSMLAGTVLSEHAAHCNSREPRFLEGKQWRYRDAREVTNECIAMARKRCKVHLVVDVLGLRPWLHTEEEMEAALRQKAEQAAMTPNAGSAS